MKVIKAIFNVLVFIVAVLGCIAAVVYALYMRGLEISVMHKILEMP